MLQGWRGRNKKTARASETRTFKTIHPSACPACLSVYTVTSTLISFRLLAVSARQYLPFRYFDSWQSELFLHPQGRRQNRDLSRLLSDVPRRLSSAKKLRKCKTGHFPPSPLVRKWTICKTMLHLSCAYVFNFLRVLHGARILSSFTWSCYWHWWISTEDARHGFSKYATRLNSGQPLRYLWDSEGVAPRILIKWNSVVSFKPWPTYPSGKRKENPLKNRFVGQKKAGMDTSENKTNL